MGLRDFTRHLKDSNEVQAPLLLDKLIAKVQAINVKNKASLIDDIKELYEVTFREAYKSGQEHLEDDDEL